MTTSFAKPKYIFHYLTSPFYGTLARKLPLDVFLVLHLPDTYRQHKSLHFLAGEKVRIDETFYTDLEEVIAWADIRYIIIHPELLTDEQLRAITSTLREFVTTYP